MLLGLGALAGFRRGPLEGLPLRDLWGFQGGRGIAHDPFPFADDMRKVFSVRPLKCPGHSLDVPIGIFGQNVAPRDVALFDVFRIRHPKRIEFARHAVTPFIFHPLPEIKLDLTLNAIIRWLNPLEANKDGAQKGVVQF